MAKVDLRKILVGLAVASIMCVSVSGFGLQAQETGIYKYEGLAFTLETVSTPDHISLGEYVWVYSLVDTLFTRKRLSIDKDYVISIEGLNDISKYKDSQDKVFQKIYDENRKLENPALFIEGEKLAVNMGNFNLTLVFNKNDLKGPQYGSIGNNVLRMLYGNANIVNPVTVTKKSDSSFKRIVNAGDKIEVSGDAVVF
jgi:hypothetical protein